MQTTNKTYKFIGKVLSDGHLSIPDEVAKNVGKEFEVMITPVDEVKRTVSLYFNRRLKKNGRIKNLILDSAKIEEAIKTAFGTTDIDKIIESVRR